MSGNHQDDIHTSAKAAFYQTLSSIPPGYFTSYGRLASLCGVHVRQIQAWLRSLPRESGLPWFRIINSQRKITEHPGSMTQYELLKAEGLLADYRGRFPKDRYWPDCLSTHQGDPD
ncbi:MGMT family protein [Saccharospirillum alexandrii]|uniref:MGMT family protein n=1 Tax=Saccharospirillum alexandrii TaxID=2448477 RepID=UPI000FDB058C